MTERKTFEQLGADLGKLVGEKNTTYGSATEVVARVLAALYPKGIQPWQLEDALLLTRIGDKMCRIANRTEGKLDGMGESPYKDIAGYGLIGEMKDQKTQQSNGAEQCDARTHYHLNEVLRCGWDKGHKEKYHRAKTEAGYYLWPDDLSIGAPEGTIVSGAIQSGYSEEELRTFYRGGKAGSSQCSCPTVQHPDTILPVKNHLQGCGHRKG